MEVTFLLFLVFSSHIWARPPKLSFSLLSFIYTRRELYIFLWMYVLLFNISMRSIQHCMWPEFFHWFCYVASLYMIISQFIYVFYSWCYLISSQSGDPGNNWAMRGLLQVPWSMHTHFSWMHTKEKTAMSAVWVYLTQENEAHQFSSSREDGPLSLI